MDLNLLRVFNAIYETRNLTKASERLYVSQSAVSQSLAKMRQKFDDELFQRSDGEMVPTVLAHSLYKVYSPALEAIENTLTESDHFDPALSEQVFRFALSELGEIGWLPAIFKAVHSQAPHVRIEVVPLLRENLSDSLTRGTIDLAIAPVKLEGAFERKHIKWQSYVVVMSEQNPFSRKKLSVAEFDSCPRIKVESDSGGDLISAAFREADVATEPQVSVQHFTTLPQLLAESGELVAVIPESIAEGWKNKWPLALHELPFEMKPVELNLYRRKTNEKKNALNWVYNTVAHAIGGSSGEFGVIQ